MYWDGSKLTNKEEAVSFFHEQFKYWGVYQVWTDKPEHFMEADYTPIIYVIVHSMDDYFDTVPITERLSHNESESYGCVRVESISTLDYVDLSGYTLVWEDGEWIAN